MNKSWYLVVISNTILEGVKPVSLVVSFVALPSNLGSKMGLTLSYRSCQRFLKSVAMVRVAFTNT